MSSLDQKSVMESVISDDPDLVIDRDEADKKLQRVEFYLKRVRKRLDGLNKNLSKLYDSSDEAAIKEGLKAFKLSSGVSEVIE